MTWKLSEGDWCHVEIPTRDPARSRQFYASVFGWEFIDVPGWDGKIIKTSEDGIEASLGTLAEDRGILPYIMVKGEMDAMLRRVKEHGGSVIHPVTELEGAGRFAQVADPEGRAFGFWQDAG